VATSVALVALLFLYALRPTIYAQYTTGPDVPGVYEGAIKILWIALFVALAFVLCVLPTKLFSA
jgi:Na+-driven multidrug efflux pump